MFRRKNARRNQQMASSGQRDGSHTRQSEIVPSMQFPVATEYDLEILQPQVLSELQTIVGSENVLSEEADLIAYSIDGTWIERRPLAVVLPASAEEVSAILRIANREHIVVAPRGSASGLSGGSVPLGGGIALSMTRMNHILEIDRINHVAVVEPGVITATLQATVEKLGLFYPPDPSSLKVSAIGGNVAENAGGARCLKYGVTADYVMGLQVVLPTGEIIRVGGRVVKNVTGYNLRQLFTGAEGTLGVITEVTLKLLPLPKYRLTALAEFERLDDAAATVTAVTSAGILPASIELMDQLTIQCVEDLLQIGLPIDAEALLLFSFDGNYEQVVQGELEAASTICTEHGARKVQTATTAGESEQLWQARRSVSPALARRKPNKLGEDISVPRSAVPQIIRQVRAIATKYDLLIPVFGHAGDGNLHPNILCNRRDAGEMQRVRAAAAEIFAAAVACGGTLSGEHGIGLLKKEFMEEDLGHDTVEAMKKIKLALDPNNILNPGKIFPTGHSEW
ncbi:MAG TPA: FAD-linked oxidase C-terminal domain-containing protein [Ktedonobacteraceae bacterium]|nr:FAD-linked oxidase C-terminal domain-containing protein [Ktedonobacteraceae bacterium]